MLLLHTEDAASVGDVPDLNTSQATVPAVLLYALEQDCPKSQHKKWDYKL